MTSILKGWGVIERRGWGLANVFAVQSFFLLKKIGFATWPEIMLSQTLIYHWQEIFLLILVSDSEASFRYHCIVCGLNRTIERVISLNVTWIGFVFVRSHARCGCCSIVCWREGVRLKLNVHGQGGRKILDVVGQGGGDLKN